MHEFVHPLSGRYASPSMKRLFSPATRIGLWRRLWLELMRAERDLGVGIPEEAIAQLAACLEPTAAEMRRAVEIERETRHDVMAHIRALAEVAPAAGPWLHLGATSCYVTDNADLIILREAVRLLLGRATAVVAALAAFARRHAALPCLGHTHFQPAQPTTVGKRATLWLWDLLADLERLEVEAGRLLLRGAKGATGTQASFLQLLGSHERVQELDERIAAAFGFSGTYPVTGQTSPRKPEFYLLACLSGLAQSAARFATDVRLLMRLKELDEPAETTQVGSSAMPYKRNPMRSERMCALARYLVSLEPNAAWTAAGQWLERTLDDSANRRLVLPEAFLCADAILLVWRSVAAGLQVYPAMILRNLDEELPFLALEEILLAATAAGGDRQELHERLRSLSRQAARRVKESGEPNPLLSLVAADPVFGLSVADLARLLDPARFVGRAPEQVEAYLEGWVEPWLAAHPEAPDDERAPEI
ncbi:MAG TPA: adenylosuccinate lyase [Thermoanaerobaculaceae bacterium]|nr:adenylosuccinate lyase [Thermoanaerobaculaceae bacterium]HRS14632.1 adenylosuccinate lyase [Thermoanaerobaculaceae bacterium]